jgi:hypothetical protein
VSISCNALRKVKRDKAGALGRLRWEGQPGGENPQALEVEKEAREA